MNTFRYMHKQKLLRNRKVFFNARKKRNFNTSQVGQGALPRKAVKDEKDRGTERSELMMFTCLDKKVRGVSS